MIPARVRAALRELSPTYWTLWVGTLVNRIGGFVIPFLALYLTRERGLSTAEAGLIVSLYGAGSIVSGPVGGVLADRVGRRPTLLLGLGGGSFAMFALGLAHTLPAIAAATLVLGFVAETYRPAVAAMISDVVPPEQRVRAYAYLYWAVNLGFSIAPFLAGLVTRAGYFWLFAGDAATTFGYAIIVWARIPETRPAVAAKREHGALRGLAVVFTDGVFMSFVALTFLTAMIFQQLSVALPLDMRSHGISEAEYGTVIALNGVMIVFVQPFVVRAIAGARRSRVLVAYALLTGFGFAIYAFAGVVAWPLALYTGGVVIWTLGEIAGSPVNSAIISDLAPPELRGRYQGAFIMAWGSAAFAGPLVGSIVLDHLGAVGLWVSCGVMGVLVAIAQLATAGARRRRMEQIRAAAVSDGGARVVA